jgi:antagonist of KipI
MSLKIVKPGILDTVQDPGRFGYQHLGINPGGVMDYFSAAITNMLVGNDPSEALVEFHFPSPTFFFELPALIALGGSDFSPMLNGEPVPLWHPIIVSKNSILQFRHWKKGARCYLALREKLLLDPWLGSYSTNLKAKLGGFQGRSLQKDDTIIFRENYDYKNKLGQLDHLVLPWRADTGWMPFTSSVLSVLPGPEWEMLPEAARHYFLNEQFRVASSADRMGYRLEGNLPALAAGAMISGPVSFGTIQWLPDGQIIILMADHQASGGYPRIAQVATANLTLLAQSPPGEEISFRLIDLSYAEDLLIHQQQHLQQLQNACTLKIHSL